MNIILLNNFCKKKGSIDICVPRALSITVVTVLLMLGLSSAAGFYFGQEFARETATSSAQQRVVDLIEEEKQQLQDEKDRVRAHLDALAIRLGSLQAHVLRLDALGDRLVDIASLDKGEFDFDEEPAVGGLDSSETAISQTPGEIITGVENFNQLLSDRIQKLDFLEELLMNSQLQEEITPSGRPILKGWLSSRYGKRIDPKNGKKAFHHGLDYAGKSGSDVVAVASGIVIRSETQKGFGHMVEVRHPNGYSTIYAHNKKNLVKVGDMVKKGQKIALLGSTGRSTGPHVHFEVRRNSHIINPVKFVNR